MGNYLEKTLYRYIIATLDSPTKYLIFKDGSVSFTSHISRGTKTVGENTAQSIKNDFYMCTGRTDIELVVLPIKISYELIREDIIDRDDSYEMLS